MVQVKHLVVGHWMVVLVLPALFGCAEDPELQVSSRPATTSECPNGGLVFTVQNEIRAPLCNGIDGRVGDRGERGEPGAMGATGATGATGMAGQNAQEVADVLSLVRPKNSSIVIIDCTDGAGSRGTGTKTAAGTVLTAQHVVEGMSNCELFSASPNMLLGSMLSSATRGQRDQAEMQVTWTTSGEILRGLEPTLQTTPQLGDLVTIVGFPDVYDGIVYEHQFTAGFVTSTSLSTTFANVPAFEGSDVEWESAWSTDAIVWHGNSGGPVFDAAGNWIGMAVGTFNGGPEQQGPDISVVLPLF